MIEGRVRVGRLCESTEQERPQLAESLPGPGRNVRAARPLFQSGHCSLGVCLVCKDPGIDQLSFFARQRFGDETAKNRAHREHFPLERGREFLSRAKSETQRESSQVFRSCRNGVGLLLGFNLQTVLGAAEEAIRAVKIDNFIGWNQFELGEAPERLQCARFLQERVPRSVNKLQGLHNELDFANPAAAEFDVAFQILLSDNIAFDPSFDVGDLFEQIGCGTFRVNERLMLPQEFVSELTTAADPTSFDQRQALPGFPETAIIVLHAFKRSRQWPGGTFRAQPNIDTKK